MGCVGAVTRGGEAVVQVHGGVGRTQVLHGVRGDSPDARGRRVAADALGVGAVGGEVGRPVVVDLDFAVQEERLVAVAGFVRRGGVEVVHAADVGGRTVEVVVRTTATNTVDVNVSVAVVYD